MLSVPISGVHAEVCSVWLEFGLVSSSTHWEGGCLVCESVRKAEMLSAYFDGKLSRDPVVLPSTCHPTPSLTIVTGSGAACTEVHHRYPDLSDKQTGWLEAHHGVP